MRRIMNKMVTGVFVLALPFLCSTAILGAEDETGWSDTAEFSMVMTSGNSEGSTLGFKNTALHTWTNALFTLNAGGIRVETTTKTRFENPAGSGLIEEAEATEKTAENYYLNGRYDRNISERFFWYTGAGWDRNRFAGIDNRYTLEGGVGNVWFDKEDHKFRTLYGLTYTDQEDIIPNPLVSDSFAGARFSWSYLNQFGSNTTYENVFAMDLNLDESDDWRGNMINSIAVAMSSRMALKVSHQILYDNMPSLISVPTTTVPVLVPLDETDTIFTASLVVSF